MKCLGVARFTAVVILFCHALPALAQKGQEDLTQRSLVDLMSIEVTSAAKKEQKMSETAAAIFVITQDDIRRSGATSIPDLLRMVPGVEVAQINSSLWAIAVRGFNGQYSNKLLVLIDGRSVYTPMLSGVYWNEQDVPLDNIERIEVIRGPSATLWGADAVNGVINVITKQASDTQGGMLSAGVGTYERGFGAARYGGKLGNNISYRLSADGLAYSRLPNATSRNGGDDWKIVHGGFRFDAKASAKDSLTLQGDSHSGDAGVVSSSVLSISPPVNGDLFHRARFFGWDLLSKWDHTSSPHSQTSLQVYFDRDLSGDDLCAIGSNSFDLNFQHHLSWGQHLDLVWGLGYRANSDRALPTPYIIFTPPTQSTQLFSAFVQDEISVLPQHVKLILGAKLEHNGYTGFGLQPNARINWSLNQRNTFWAAVSQAERTPSRSDTNIRVNFAAYPGPAALGGLPVLFSIFGNPRSKNEVLRAVEAGYRSQLTNRLSVDGTAFFNHYRDLGSWEPGTPFLESTPSPLHLVNPTLLSNLLHGETHGLEVSADWQLLNHWSLSPSYSFLTAHIHRDAAGQDSLSPQAIEGGNSNHEARLRSHVDVPGHWGWNASAYFVGGLPSQGISSYTRLDTNLTKQLAEKLSITLAGDNLLNDRHWEYRDPHATVLSSMIKRSVYAKLTWWF